MKMKNKTLHDLLRCDPASRALYERLSPDVQTALQEQRQNIRTSDELKSAAEAFAKRTNP